MHLKSNNGCVRYIKELLILLLLLLLLLLKALKQQLFNMADADNIEVHESSSSTPTIARKFWL